MVTLAELYNSLKECFKHRVIKFTAYIDSKVVLAWVRNASKTNRKFPKFVKRRVTKIRNILEPREVHYVKSNENPADPASRGLTADQLSSSTLWFLGPSWLQNEDLPVTDWTENTQAFASESWEHDDIFAKYSSWWRVLRVAAYCLRLRFSRETVYLNASEIRRAKLAVIRYYQYRHLSDVIENLKNVKIVHKRHWLHRRSPFLDSNNIIRIGG